jgi:hypothetical protein
MFSINLKLGVHWSFLLIFDTVSHKTNGSGQKEMQNKIDGQKRSSIFWVVKKKVQVFYGQKGISPLYNGLELGGNTWESWADVVRVYCDIFKYDMVLLFMICYERVYWNISRYGRVSPFMTR